MKKIGIFGGSFDPAHFGHLSVSLFCLENLKLDEIKWVISKNPLKSKSRNSDSEKLKIAKSIAQFNKNINVSLSDKISAIDIIKEVYSLRNNCCYIWIMGLDSYLTLDLWKDYSNLINSIPMIVFNRIISSDLILNNEIMNNLFEKNEIITKEGNIVFSESQLLKFLLEYAKNYGQEIHNMQDLKFNANYCKVYFISKILSDLSSTTISH